MPARKPVLAFYLIIQVDEELTIGGVKTAHYTGCFVYMNLESTGYWIIWAAWKWSVRVCRAGLEFKPTVLHTRLSRLTC